jgi:hypothetical protein
MGKLKFKPQIATVAIAGGLALILTGCFQNLSGTDSASIYTSRSQSNFTDTTPSTGSFDGSALNATASLVNTYAGTDSSGNYNGTFGMVINLQKSFETAIGAATLNSLLASAATTSTVTSMPVKLTINEFKIQAQFPFGKVVSNGALLNVMIVRPSLADVDFAAGYLPDTAPVVQTTPGYIYTYGGLQSGDPLALMTMFYRNAIPYGTGFLPNSTNQAWGQNFPAQADATANAEFMRLTPEVGKIFGAICTNPNDNTFACDPSFAGAQSSPSSYLLAIHTDIMTTADFVNAATGGNANTANAVNLRAAYAPYPSAISNLTDPAAAGTAQYYFKVSKAWVIYPTASGPKGLELCNANYDAQTSTYPADANGTGLSKAYSVADKRACNCNNFDLNAYYNSDNGTAGQVIPLADRQKIYDYCIQNLPDGQTPAIGSTAPLGSSSAKGVENKKAWLVKAVRERVHPPTSGILTAPANATPNGITFVSVP